MGKPLVAIVGRPNVGKSSLFNRLVGRRQAIVLDQPGITRDRVYGDVQWGDRVFAIIDTGGYVSNAADTLTQSMLTNIQLAVEESDLVVFMGDAVDGPTSDEYAIASYLRKTGKPVIVAVNKVDNPAREDLLHPFYGLGFEALISISALHGIQTGDLLDLITSLLPQHNDEVSRQHKDAIPVAIIGRPNVGKSTLLNCLLGKPRSLVDSTPGTTRDPVDVLKEYNGKKYLFVDTAGIRRKGRIERGAEWVSVLMAHQSLDRCKVALLMLDAKEGPVEGDAHVFGLAQEMKKACVILANKWDTLEKDDKTSGEMANRIRETIKFLPYAPIMMISGLTGQRVSKIYDLIDSAYASYRRQVPPDELDELLDDIVQRHPPPGSHGKKQIIFYRLSQARVGPPTFILETNQPEAIHYSYERYLVNRIYERFGLEGSPIVLRLKQRRKKKRKGTE